MGRRSSIRKLPEELRKELDRLLSDGQMTIVQLTDHLRGLGASVSKSAVGRYSQDFERVARDIRDSRMMAEALASRLSDSPEQPVGRLVIASLEGILLRAQRQLVTEDGQVDIKAATAISMAVRDLQAALKSNVDTELKIRKQAAKDAADAAEEAAAEQGLTGATVDAIKARILGIVRPA